MERCCICGKDVDPEVDCETRFTGRIKYVCFDCLKNGNKQIIAGRAEYFDKTYEGQRRLENSRRKKRER